MASFNNKCDDKDTHDIAVVGAGMIGSAAARHITMTHPDLSTCLIGPQEPTSRSKESVHGAYHDAGRIIEFHTSKPVWDYLAKQSVHGIRQLEQQFGVQILTAAGTLDCYSSSRDDGARCSEAGSEDGVRILDRAALHHTFPYLRLPANTCARYDSGPNAGHINPRRLVWCQQQAARDNGCRVINDVVIRVEECHGGSQPTRAAALYRITTRNGLQIWSGKILFCMGSYSAYLPTLCENTNNPGLLPKLDVTNVTETVVLMEVSEYDALNTLRTMPNMVYSGTYWGKLQSEYATINTGGWEFDADKYHCYILPPILYPDGKYYVKIGHGNVFSHIIKDLDHLVSWYRGGEGGVRGDQNARRMLLHELQTLLPGVTPVSVTSDACVTSRSASRHPYIHPATHPATHTAHPVIQPTQPTTHPTHSVVIACAGNGYAAKASDAIGRLAADLVTTGRWAPQDPELSGRRGLFMARCLPHCLHCYHGNSKI